jgi:hypothetical protein
MIGPPRIFGPGSAITFLGLVELLGDGIQRGPAAMPVNVHYERYW